MPTIKETYLLTGTNSDVLKSPSRLESMPATGTVTIEVSATECNATNSGQLEISTADGQTPVQTAFGYIPANGDSTSDATLNNETEQVWSIAVEQGGHLNLNYTENGAVLTLLTVTLDF